MTRIKLAHLSDLHFGHFCFNFKQFLSKQWIGNFNHFLFRNKSFKTKDLNNLFPYLNQMEIDYICITGDFASTSTPQEFREAKNFIASFSPPVFTLPGNHDVYTKKSVGLFYDFFPSEKGILGFSLQQDRLFATQLKENLYWIALDCALPTPPFNAYGVFTELLEENLLTLLKHLPAQSHAIMGNHFPLFDGGRKKHDLKRSERLRALLQAFPQVKLYLHGHDHESYIINKEGFPIVINCGSSTLAPLHFFLVEIEDHSFQIQHFSYLENRWTSRIALEKSFQQPPA